MVHLNGFGSLTKNSDIRLMKEYIHVDKYIHIKVKNI